MHIYIIRRLLLGIPTILGAAILIFVIMRIAPGDVASLIAVGGAVWACHYHRMGRLWGVWISHCIVDVAALSIGYHILV